MDRKKLEKLAIFLHEIDRNKIRYNGIGPRLHEFPGKIWPRDSYDVENECNKILYPDLRRRIKEEAQINHVEDVIKRLFLGFTRVNIAQLFNRYCPLDPNYFNKVSFQIHYALDAHTSYKQIICLIHQVVRSISSKVSKSNEDFASRLFGCNHNYSIFKAHIKSIVTANKLMCRFKVGFLVTSGDDMMKLNTVTWLQGLDADVSSEIFLLVIYAIIRYMIELLRRYFYITCSGPYQNQLFYFRYDLWQKINNRQIKELIHTHGVLVPLIASEVDLSKSIISKMIFLLKDDGLRLICTRSKEFANSDKNFQLRAALNIILKKWSRHTRFDLVDLLQSLRYFQDMKVKEGKSIYIVRADMKNCFQSIDQDNLVAILRESLASFHPDVLKFYLCRYARKYPPSIARLLRWVTDPSDITSNPKYDRVSVEKEISVPLEEFVNDYIKPQVIKPIVRESKTSKIVFQLVKGLRQGSTFSPKFCSIYIQIAFEKYLKEFLTSSECKIFRHVDDILFISTDLNLSKRFMHKMLGGIKDFNLRMNLDKLACNFQCPNLDDELCRLDKHVVFYKQLITIDTLQCSYDYFSRDLQLQYTFKVNPYTCHSVMSQSINRSKIDFIHLDCKLNGLDKVIENIFERALLFAHRVGTFVLISLHYRKLCKQSGDLMINFIRIVARKINSTIKSGLRREIIENGLSYYQVRLIVISAFEATWQTRGLRHRKVELEALNLARKRYTMSYIANLSSTSLAQASTIDLDSKTREMVVKFPHSNVAKEFILPKKPF